MTTLTKMISTGMDITNKVIFKSEDKDIYKTENFSYENLPDILKVSVIYKISAENDYIVFTI